MTPAVSVLMSVFNGERFLREAIDSVLNQTLTDLEFIIVDDGSTDRSAEIIRSYSDPRVRLIVNEENLGLSRSLNKGLEAIGGRCVARMDCDDICHPARLERQVAFMDAHGEVGVCGTWAKDIDASGAVIKERLTPTGKRLDYYYWIPSPIIHPSAMIRADLLKTLKYDANVRYAQDFDLWLRSVKAGYQLANLPEYLFLYRVHDAAISESRLTAQLESSYLSFCEHISPQRMDYEVFMSFFYGTCQVPPLRRARILAELARRIGRSPRGFLADDLRYSLRWLRQRAYDYICKTPALQPMRRMRRQLKSLFS